MTTTPAATRTATPLSLYVLGTQSDPRSERGVECPGELPAASDPGLVERARAAKAELGEKVFILGHHYQRDEVIQFADVTGDSFKLARDAAARPDAEFIVFCGVHFMAESADILTGPDQKVILPDLAAGCSMADMARLAQVEDAWDALADAGIADVTVPVTYMNSSADIKAFCGRHDGVVCTSSNAKSVLNWAFARGEKVLFFPDQHLGRNTAVLELGLSLADCVVYDPHQVNGGLTTEQLRDAKMILWKGHCSVHGRFSEAAVDDVRARIPGVQVLVHPECQHEVVLKADLIGSTEFIIKTIEKAASRVELGHRHRAQPGQAVGQRPPRQADFLPRAARLLLRDDEPDRPAAPGVVAGEPRGRPRRQPDHRGRRDRALRQAGAPADARPAGRDREGLTVPGQRPADRSGASDRVVEAVIELLVAEGFEGVSVRKVAALTGVSIGAVQHHFPTKTAMLTAAMDATSAQFQARLSQRVPEGSSPADALRQLTALLVGAEPDERPATVLWLQRIARAAVDPAVAEQQAREWGDLAELIVALLAAARPDRSAEWVADRAAALLALVDGLAIAVALEPQRMPRERALLLAEQTVEAALVG